MDLVIRTQLNEAVIYEATKNIFSGKKARMRDRGATVLNLLSDEVYESTPIARQRFPDLFEPPTEQTSTGTQIEAESTGTAQAALNGMGETDPDESQDMRDSQECPAIAYVTSDSTASDIAGSSLPFPVQLPFPTEHLLMEKLQKTLELACYQYGTRELQSIMQERNWDCPEAVELNQWADLLGHDGNLQWQGRGKPLKEVLRSIAQIRHTTVHRIRTDSTGLQQFLADAEDLARALGDDIYTEVISKLRLDAESTITELAQNKQSIQLQLDKAQDEIAKRRAELDLEEQENLRHMKREDKRYCAEAGEKLQKALNLIGSFAVASETGDAVLNGDRDSVSDDSNLDNSEHFEDCSES
ncbi:hypothetical protein FACUT_13587 [Fusarium acutatum]|uniref:Ubiquinol-cytochrome-c reductase cytochrome c1 n=1 Tax=Fusarium acutatum TaxID=78861 RepID=A0A8H4NHV7_9HYPO|nr:hypothetical protein FACUT_13587 [Fusarium acutatum]